MKKKILALLPLFLLMSSLVGCRQNGQDGSGTDWKPSDVNALVSTPITDSFNLPQRNELEGKKFAGPDENAVDHIGYVSLRSCTDGDTANFIQEGYKDNDGGYISIKTRFLAVNTPESTAKVEPWGKKASIFTKNVLTAAQESADSETASLGHKVYNIVLINDITISDIKDTAGNRWLAYIWYRRNSTSNWRLLNLELVEQGYSMNQLFVRGTTCNYLDQFVNAEKRVKDAGWRVHGTLDPDYDYSVKTYQYSLWYIKKHYDEIGITEEGSSGLQLIVTALVVGIQGDNMILRDVLYDDEQIEEDLAAGITEHEYSGLYAYAGFNQSIGSTLGNVSETLGMDGTGLGLIVRFYCRATVYSGNVQLSDVKGSLTGKQRMDFIADDTDLNKYKQELSWSYEYGLKGDDLCFDDLNKDLSSTRIEPSSISNYDDPSTPDVTYDDLLPYQYKVVDTELEIRAVSPFDTDEDGSTYSSGNKYWYKKANGTIGYTVYAQMIGKNDNKILMNIRVDASLTPFIEPAFFGTSNQYDLTSEDSPVGKKFHVTGYMSLYFGKFQIQLLNNYRSMNYISPIVEE